MVEQRANLDYGADDTSIEDDITHTPAQDPQANAGEEVVIVEVDEVVEEENPEGSTYGAP